MMGSAVSESGTSEGRWAVVEDGRVREAASAVSSEASLRTEACGWSGLREWAGWLSDTLREGRGVELGPLEQRAMVETQLSNAGVLVAVGLAMRLGDVLSPLLGLWGSRGTWWALGCVGAPLWALWAGESWQGGPEGMAALRRRLLCVGVCLGVASGNALSQRTLRLRPPPLFAFPLLRGLGTALAPRALLWDRAGLLLASLGSAVVGVLALREASGEAFGPWELWTLALSLLSLVDTQVQLDALVAGRFRGWLYSLSLVTASVWTHQALALSLAVPHSVPCFTPPFNDHELLTATKQVLCRAARQFSDP